MKRVESLEPVGRLISEAYSAQAPSICGRMVFLVCLAFAGLLAVRVHLSATNKHAHMLNTSHGGGDADFSYSLSTFRAPSSGGAKAITLSSPASHPLAAAAGAVAAAVLSKATGGGSDLVEHPLAINLNIDSKTALKGGEGAASVIALHPQPAKATPVPAPPLAPAATAPTVATTAMDEGISAQEAVVAALTGLSVLHHYAPAPESEAQPIVLPVSTHAPGSNATAASAPTAAGADTTLSGGDNRSATSQLTAKDIASTTVGMAGRDDEVGLDAEQLAAKWESENPWWDEAERQAQRQKAKLKVKMKRAAEQLAGVTRRAAGPAIEYDPPGTHSPILDLLACLRTQMERPESAAQVAGGEEDPCDPAKVAGA